MTVPFLDLRAAYLELRSEVDVAVSRVLSSGRYILGEEVEDFEEAYASYCGVSHCVGVGNGLDALYLGLRALGVGPGDEVIVSSNGYIATWLAVSMIGAVPVPVEPDPDTHNLDPKRIEAAITGRTRVVLPTHLYGQPADMHSIIEVARRHKLLVLEDAAQAHGAAYDGTKLGGHGDLVAWSFYPGKNLGAFGDGGAITTNNSDYANCVRMLGNYGSKEKYYNQARGINSRLDPLQAAVLSVKLRFLDDWNQRRAEIAKYYAEHLTSRDLLLPSVPAWASPAWHLYVIRTQVREDLMKCLAASGIETLIHYPLPPHLQKAYADSGFSSGQFPIAERLAAEVLSLPIGPHLTKDQLGRVVDALNQ